MTHQGQSVTSTLTIGNRLGLHARPAMAFVDIANRFDSAITVRKSDSSEIVDGKSIMQMLMLAATQGTQLELQITGPDAQQLADALHALAARNFDEE
jgi:phosphocarrier protein